VGAGGGGVERRYRGAAETAFGGSELDGEVGGALVDLVHFEDVVGGRSYHPILVGEDDGLEDVDDLGDVGHFDPGVVGVEDVKVQGGDEGVAEAVLLPEGAGVGCRVVPGTPLVHEQADALLGVVPVHDLGVTADDLVHTQSAGEGGVPFGFAELGAGALAFPVARWERVIVER